MFQDINNWFHLRGNGGTLRILTSRRTTGSGDGMNDSAECGESRTLEDSNLPLMISLLGLGLLIHKTHLPEPLASPWPVLATLMAVAATWRPGVRVVANVFALTIVLETAWFWPHVYNHSVYILFVSLTLLAWTIGRSWSRQDDAPGAAVDRDLFPVLRCGVYVLFFFAIWHKINFGFLDPQGSCAVEHPVKMMRVYFLNTMEIGIGSRKINSIVRNE